MNFDIKVVKYEDKELIKECDVLLKKLLISESIYDQNCNLDMKLGSLEVDLKEENNYILVATVHEEVVGFIYGSIIHRKNYKDKVAKIIFLYVLEEYRNQTIGRNLMKSLNHILQNNGVNYIEVSVYVENIKAIEFYKRFGFGSYVSNLRVDISDK